MKKNALYKLDLQNLEFECIIGILDFERLKKQKVLIEGTFLYENKDNFLDYSLLKEYIKKLMIEKQFLLLEDALDFFENSLYIEFTQLHSFTLNITKPDIMRDCKVSLSKI